MFHEFTLTTLTIVAEMIEQSAERALDNGNAAEHERLVSLMVAIYDTIAQRELAAQYLQNGLGYKLN